MICETCYSMLRGHVGGQWRGTFDLHFGHHNSRSSLQKSSSMSCGICRSLHTELLAFEEKNRKSIITTTNRHIWQLISGQWWFRPVDRKPLISAYLSPMYGSEWSGDRGKNVYRLDFKTKESARVGSFVLKEPTESYSTRHTPFTNRTSSDEVLELAKRWIKDCEENHTATCSRDKTWYPTRLLDLGVQRQGLQAKKRKPATSLNTRSEVDKVKLVLKKDVPHFEGNYVTLSHCWGKAKVRRLLEDYLEEFQKGIALDSLPLTFRDAIHFARRLGTKENPVNYIWIDSLCIIQGNSPGAIKDWLSESSQMYEIYKNSYCNLSATAATDGTQGMYRKREARELWENETILSTEGIPGPPPSNSVQRCTVMDLKFWEKNVDEAAVNTRGWVLQERLLAPRVVHFCEKQIAWECHEKDAAESWPDGLPDFQLRDGDVVHGGRLKDLVLPVPEDFKNEENTLTSPVSNGKGLNKWKITNIKPDTYGPWKRVVEKYSRTNLTNATDKLIALSGIAQMMSKEFGTNNRYVAGLWSRGLVSQLLWRVDPIYENGQFFYRSSRPKYEESELRKYRAPSFSWAAVDAQNGIRYANTTEEGLHITIKSEFIHVEPESSDNKFGLLKEGAHIVVAGIMKKIELKKLRENGQDRYGWQMNSNPTVNGKPLTFRNVYLDAPADDEQAWGILGSEGGIYCLPVRTDSGKYLICLLLQLLRDGSGKFRRVGLTKVPPYISGGHQSSEEIVLSRPEHGDELADCPWDAESGGHTICIV